MNEMMKSNGFKIAALVIAFILVALLGFAIGMEIGSRKALFSCRWGENYEKNFIGRNDFPGDRGPGPMMMHDFGFGGRDFRNAHGLSGAVISISGNNLILKDNDGNENTVTVTDETLIKSRGSNLQLNDIKAGDRVVVMGKPGDNGTIDADLIRVFETLPSNVNQNSNQNQTDSVSNNQ